MATGKKSLKLWHHNSIDIKSKINKFAMLKRFLLSIFIFTLPFNTYGIFKILVLETYNPDYTSIHSNTINPKSLYHPTSIPWIKDSSSCKKSGRVWKNKQCWDEEHSPSF